MVSTPALEMVVLGLKCRTTKVVRIARCEEDESLGPRHTSTGRKPVIGICDFEMQKPS